MILGLNVRALVIRFVVLLRRYLRCIQRLVLLLPAFLVGFETRQLLLMTHKHCA